MPAGPSRLLLLSGAPFFWLFLQQPRVTAPPSPEVGGRPVVARLRWLTEPGAENIVVRTRSTEPAVIFAVVPGALYHFALRADGSLHKLRKTPADSAAPYGVAGDPRATVVTSQDGGVSLWEGFTLDQPGRRRWRRDLGERAMSVSWNGGERVYVATWKNRLFALEASDGEPLWTRDLGGRAQAAPLIAGDDVYVATKAKTLYRVDAATGRVRWKATLPAVAVHPPVLFGQVRTEEHPARGQPLVAVPPGLLLGQEPRLLVVGAWDGSLTAFDAKGGREVWSTRLPDRITAPLAAGGGSVMAVTARGVIAAYDSVGGLRWQRESTSRGEGMLTVLAEATPKLLVTSGVLLSLDLGVGTEVESYPRSAVEELRQRFSDAMLEGEKTYSEAEKRALLAREAFDISGRPFGPARVFGSHLVFGTDEGWVYVFDVHTLRPRARYHAGPAEVGPVLLGPAGPVVASGEELTALDGNTGGVVWRRNVGGAVEQLAGHAHLLAVSEERLSSVVPEDGTLRWSLRGAFTSVTIPGVPSRAETTPEPEPLPWLAADEQGRLTVVGPTGTQGASFFLGGELLPPLWPEDGNGWIIANRSGALLRLAWRSERLERDWVVSFGSTLEGAWLAGDVLLLEPSEGGLVAWDETTRGELWRAEFPAGTDYRVLASIGRVAAVTETELSLLDPDSGVASSAVPLTSPPVAMHVRDGVVMWLDRRGRAWELDLDRGVVGSLDLEVDIKTGTPLGDGFLLITNAGEVGRLEWSPQPRPPVTEREPQR